MKDNHLLIVGLGNSGKEYINTRHNAGSDFINLLSKDLDISLNKDKYLLGKIGSKEFGTKKVSLFIPDGYMNNSGRSIKKLIKDFNLELSDLLIVHDELDLPLGTIKLKDSGGHGGHNGLRDIIERLGNRNEFKRLRIGIDHPGKGKDVTDYVLKQPSKKDKEILTKKMNNSIESIIILIQEGIDKATLNLHT
ncbi:MAG: aminoacyl-tRNA hydrolase [Gammaproteobacteria bacterium]